MTDEYYDNRDQHNQPQYADDDFVETHDPVSQAVQQADMAGRAHLQHPEQDGYYGDTAQLSELHGRALSGANWFFWIAALSIVNSVIFLSGADLAFVVGLGVTQIANGIMMVIAEDMGGDVQWVAMGIAFAFTLFVAAIFAGFGYFARHRHTWAFLLGMTLYTFDGLIYLLVQDWFSLGFHVFALFCLFAGFNAARELNQSMAQVAWELAPEAS